MNVFKVIYLQEHFSQPNYWNFLPKNTLHKTADRMMPYYWGHHMMAPLSPRVAFTHAPVQGVFSGALLGFPTQPSAPVIYYRQFYHC